MNYEELEKCIDELMEHIKDDDNWFIDNQNMDDKDLSSIVLYNALKRYKELYL